MGQLVQWRPGSAKGELSHSGVSATGASNYVDCDREWSLLECSDRVLHDHEIGVAVRQRNVSGPTS